MEKAKALFELMSIEELINKYKAIGFEWQIRKGTVEQRYKGINGNYEKLFRQQFKEASHKDLKKSDIVSYLDTLYLINQLNKYLLYGSEIEVFMEFMIPYSQQKRIDYLITFRKTVVILEFGYYDSKANDKKYMDLYHKKLLQAMQYEKLLQNLISSRIKTVPYVFLYSPEYGEKKECIYNHNAEKVMELADMINELFIKDTSASDEIKLLSK